MEQSESPAGSFAGPKKRGSLGKTVGIAVLVVIILGIGYYSWRSYERSKLYSIVYLQTGEIYVGRLSFFPKLTLADPYILRVTKDEKDPKKNNFQLNPLKETVWNTESLILNKSRVVFYGLLKKDSQAGKALANRGKKQDEPATSVVAPAKEAAPEAPAQVPTQAVDVNKK